MNTMVSYFDERLELVMPPRRRRAALLAVCAAAGGLIAYASPAAVAWQNAGASMTLLAMLAGVSALWSP